ncbi:unnamed protein product [Fraxinus pennsylvanica]|uniref:EAL domain-containing protein n=1 Tax=Fraxinus pennsylvanica TaxID=56036 RepID=A0AAD1ZJZ6_9LAMI|nr:unnamed protein product [Fraxinus pennsylvanica]
MLQMMLLVMDLDEPLILIHEKRISSLNAVVKVLELALKRQRPLLIVAEDVESEALATLILYKLRAGIKVFAIKAPGFGENRKASLQDLAVLTRGQVVTEELGMNLHDVELDMLGSCKKVSCTVNLSQYLRMTTTEAIVVEQPKDEKPAPVIGGGMGEMYY